MSAIPKQAKIYVAGHTGLVGSAVLRQLKKLGYNNLVLRTSQELNLIDQKLVMDFFAQEKPEYVFLCAAKVGGIMANSLFPADFIYQNLMMQTNVIHASKEQQVKRLLFLGSACIYPRECSQPIKEEYLLSGHLEKTNSPYAVAKIAGIEMCHAYNKQYKTQFLCAMPTNLYGPGDNYDLQNSHVLPALIRKMHEAKVGNKPAITLWGTGSASREFLHSDEMGDAAVFLMSLPDALFGKYPLINVGSGNEVKIRDLAQVVARIVGYQGNIEWDHSKPDGTPRRLLDVTRIASFGWTSKVSLESGIQQTYATFLSYS